MISTRENRLIRRIVNLPITIAGEVSRAVGEGMARMGIGRREQRGHFQPPQEVLVTSTTPQEFLFMRRFEEQYGFAHPFFYACRFAQVLKMAREEGKLVFVYLHSPEHPYTAPFCREALCSELVVEFIDANFVSWGGLVSGGGEGWEMALALRASTFPFSALVAPLSGDGDSIAVLQQVEGPVSGGELVEILQRTIEEQGSGFMGVREAEAERIRSSRQVREEQDAAYKSALQMDRERERFREVAIEAGDQNQKAADGGRRKANNEKPKISSNATKFSSSKVRETTKEAQGKGNAQQGKDPLVTQIQIRFPNGERREQSFLSIDKIESIFKYIDSLNLDGIGSYRLVSNFPRKFYGFEQLGMTLKDAGLHPRASLFLELL